MSDNATPNISSLSLASQNQSRCCCYCGRNEETLTTKLQKCGRCGLAEYCNRECQRGHWKLHKVKCKRLTEIVVEKYAKTHLQSGALKRLLDTLSEGTVILTIRDPDITTIGDMNIAVERANEAPFVECKSLLRVDFRGCTKLTSVGTGAFAYCSSLTSVVLPDSLTHIDKGAFAYTSLTSMVFPDSLTMLGEQAFIGCTSLTSVVLPDILTQIGYAVFDQCSSLTSVVLPDSLTQIGNGAFQNCTSLTSIVFPNSLAVLGRYAFNKCTSLTSVVLPDSLMQIGESAFLSCTSMTSVVLSDSLTQLGNAAFEGCTSLTSMVLPDSLTEIGKWTFFRCSSLTSVVLPDILTQIGAKAFARCTSLTSVVFPDSLKQVGDSALADCSSLRSVILPDSAEIGREVFDECDALLQKATSAGFDSLELYLRDRYIRITLRKLVLRLLRKYNQAVNNADGTEVDKHATALALFPADNSGSLEVGLFLQKMNVSGGDGVIGLVGYILKFV